MKTNEAFKSRFLKAEDLSKPTVAVISIVGVEQLQGFDGKTKEKPVAYFHGQKPLVLNRVNWDSLVDISGEEDSDDWADLKVELYPTDTTMGGKTVPCIRIRAPGSTAKKKAAPQPETRPDYNDDIPI